MSDIFAEISKPTCSPKPRGNSPGWFKGQQRARGERFDVVKKHHSSPPKAASAT